MSSLPPLRVPRRLVVRRQSEEQREGVEKDTENQTDQEKSVVKRTAALIQVGL